MLSVRLPKEIEIRLTRLAETTNRSKAFHIREAIERYLDDIEDAYIALYRLEHPGKRLTNEEVGRRLGIESYIPG